MQEVLEIYGNGSGCEVCKPALSYMLDMLWCGDHDEDRSARFINDRVHANIQKDGTFSVVPRIRGGVTSPDELRRIADVADKYKVPMVKITGSQRIDLLGVKKADLPKVWADLGMPSGQAYTKGVRMVKTCVGTEFCRFGAQDSTAAGIEMERRFENLFTPHKVKMATVGCPRNCAEATVKDIGMIGRRAAGRSSSAARQGRRCARPISSSRSKRPKRRSKPSELFFQYYREHANYLERTYDFVVRVGMDKVRKETVYAPRRVRRPARSAAQIEGAIARRLAGRRDPVHPTQFIPLRPLEEVGSVSESLDPCNDQRQHSAPRRPGGVGRRPRAGDLQSRRSLSRGREPVSRTRADRLPTASSAGCTVVCPLHAWKVRLDTGTVDRPAAAEACVHTFTTRVEDGIVMVQLPAIAHSPDGAERAA